jgi:hypothetical protein
VRITHNHLFQLPPQTTGKFTAVRHSRLSKIAHFADYVPEGDGVSAADVVQGEQQDAYRGTGDVDRLSKRHDDQIRETLNPLVALNQRYMAVTQTSHKRTDANKRI